MQQEKNVSKFAQDVTNELIQILEAGDVSKWRKAWEAAAINGAVNGASKKAYHGINAFWLAYKMQKEGWQDGRFYTFNQIKELGAHLKKGSKGTGVEFWLWNTGKTVDVEIDESTGEIKEVEKRCKPFSVKYYTVFNAEQIEGLPAAEKPKEITWQPVERAEKIMQASGVPFFYDKCDEAYYSPAADEIHLPPRVAFKNVNGFYSTALHELTHSTGHEKRCNRQIKNAFGTELYAMEELRAEIGATMLCAMLGIEQPGDMDKQHAAYIKSWLKALKNNPKEIFKAANDAEKAINWLLDMEKKATEKPAKKTRKKAAAKLAA